MMDVQIPRHAGNVCVLFVMGAICSLGLGCDDQERLDRLLERTKATTNLGANSALAALPESVAPKPAQRTVIARFKKPRALAIDGTSAYVVDAVSGSREQDEQLDVLRVPLWNAGERVRIASKQRMSGGPLVVRGDLFLVSPGDGPIDRLVKLGSPQGVATSWPPPLPIAPKVIGSAEPAVASDGTNLLFLAPSDDKAMLDVMRMPFAGGKPARLASAYPARVLFVAADARNVYYPESGRLMKLSIAGGGAPVEIARAVSALSAVSDGTYLYWADGGGKNLATIRRVSIGGGAPETLATGFSSPTGLVLDNESVFFIDRDAPDNGIYRVPKAGGPTVTVLRDQYAKGLTVDDKYIYWLDTAEGALCRAEK
ncbi:TolB family protein [Pendulispora albinea]|uniref:DUF5050 domain-containing protein n=1 Tax=Pendulispora albinea TaxID=2741071 RepID=A0ABZ2LZR1_9BACT